MSVASTVVTLAVLAVVLANIFLLLTLAGAATAPDQTGATRLWMSIGVVMTLLAFDAVALDQLGRYFGF